jgi:acetoin utilization deacetylase AcuC-like enzyme
LVLALEGIERYSPDVLIVGLGVDTYKEDPISFFNLTSDCYPQIGALIAGLRKPTLFVMEGGYAVEDLGINAVGVLSGFLHGNT